MILKSIYQFIFPEKMRERWAKARGQNQDLKVWHNNGCPIPPAPCVKRKVLTDYAKQFGIKVLIETGTYLGDMIFYQKDFFRQIISIEIDEALHATASKRFALDRNVRLVHGDSSKLLSVILSEIQVPCIFWLDGHYSGAGTGRGETDSPIVSELAAIFAHPITGHIIVIDDARYFFGKDGYPTLDDLKDIAKASGRSWYITVNDDIIRMLPIKGSYNITPNTN